MLKVLGRVFIILLVTALIGSAIYFIVQSTNESATLLPGEVEGQSLSGEFLGGGQGTGPRDGSGRGAGGGGGDHEETSFSSLTLLGLGKDLGIVALATVVIVLVKKVFSLRIPSTRVKTG
jgi:hypothetical protein